MPDSYTNDADVSFSHLPREQTLRDVQPVYSIKTKKTTQRPDTLTSIKTKPIEPPPDVKYTKTQQKAAGSRADTIFESPVQQEVEKGGYRRTSPQRNASEFRSQQEDEDMELQNQPTAEKFRRNPGTALDRTAYPTQAQDERVYVANNSSPSRTTQEGFKSQKVRFSDQDHDEYTERVQLSYGKPEHERIREELNTRYPPATSNKTNETNFDSYLE